MSKKILVYLDDILESINNIESFNKDVTEQAFYKNKEKQAAVIRMLEIIGEATKNIPNDFKQKNADIPWRDISDMRNFLIHAYDEVDLTRVWKVTKDDLPELKKRLFHLREKEITSE